MTVDLLNVYCDGACFKNPGGPGGWGVVVVRRGQEELARHGGEAETTNNRMELLGAIMALELTHGPVLVRSDSQYVVKGIAIWVKGWKARGWCKASAGPYSAKGEIANLDLWQRLDALRLRRVAKFEWVRGHAGDRWNERADELAGHGAYEAAALGIPLEGLIGQCGTCQHFQAPQGCTLQGRRGGYPHHIAWERSARGACGPERRNHACPVNTHRNEILMAEQDDVWRCFHCGDVFTDREAAADHFGVQIDGVADDVACRLNATDGLLVKMLREAQEELRRYHQEDNEQVRQFYALGAEHATALRRAEEKGYERGLADGRKLPRDGGCG